MKYSKFDYLGLWTCYNGRRKIKELTQLEHCACKQTVRGRELL